MLKKVINYLLLISIIHLIVAPIGKVLAAGEFNTVEVYDPNGLITSGPYYDSSSDSVVVMISSTSAKSVYYASYPDSSFSTPTTDKNLSASSYGWTHFTGMSFNCNTYYEGALYDSSNNVLVRVKLHVTGLVNPVCDASSGGIGEEETAAPTPECDACEMFSCPGWSQYMGKLDEIKNAIPPAPNWQQVSETFRDTIAPQIKADMQEILGTAPTPPAAPAAPAAPAMPSDLDDKGIAAPTGENAPGLDNSTFSSDDIKSEAPVIEVREDPTGGFRINNPVDMLPSQWEFKQNAPVEGTAPFPGYPAESTNIAPTPSEPINTAPTPTEPTNIAPTPSEPVNTAPTPGDTTETAPLPGDTTETAPIPIEEGTAPLPSNTTGTAPLPSGN